MTFQLGPGNVLPAVADAPPTRWLALKVALVPVLVSLPTAFAWWLVTPLPEFLVDSTGVLYVGRDSERVIAADGWFAICSAVAGVVCAACVFIRWRLGTLAILLGLAVGGLVAAVAAWRLGSLLGPPPVEVQARTLEVGDRFQGPLQLSALGVLVAWPLASIAIYFSLVAGTVSAPAKPARPKGRRRRR